MNKMADSAGAAGQAWIAGLRDAWTLLQTDPRGCQAFAERMLAARPGDAEATLLLAAAAWRQGRVADAHAGLQPLMTVRTKSPVAWFEWANILVQREDEHAAADALRRATSLAPGFFAAWRMLGDLLLILGDPPGAGLAYAAAVGHAVTEPALAGPARMLATGDAPAAESALKEIVQREAGHVRANWLLAEAALRVNRVREAEAVLAHCLVLAPEFDGARHSLAVLWYLQSRFAECAEQLRRLLQKPPFQPCLQILLVTCLMRIGDSAAALPLFESMLAASERRPNLWLLYGHALKTLGRTADAAVAYRRAAGFEPRLMASAYLSLADLKTEKFLTEDIAALDAALADLPRDNFARAQLHYARGYAAEQQGDLARAFGHISQGATLRRQAIDYDPDKMTRAVRAAKSVFTEAFFQSRSVSFIAEPSPIFIVGLPRSGSTLVEQILASHPLVEATLELTAMPEIAAQLQGAGAAETLPDKIAQLQPDDFAYLGRLYLSRTTQFRRLNRPFFTDKMPDNFLHIALIALSLRNAKIIDVRRRPAAAGWAIFRQFFQAGQAGQNYSYSLDEIGRYYRDYFDLISHFHAVLPGRILTLTYEMMVTDTQTQIRRLLTHCGLPFDQACLAFWQTARAIHTPSAAQVRRPIDTGGLDAWRRYDPWLAPLKSSLGPLA
jgi:tetratricopeptide (TPR) repeat protein